MTFPRTSTLLLSLTTFTCLSTVASASASPTWKLYDLRDLFGLLPPPERVEVPMPQAMSYGSMGEPTPHDPPPPPPDAVDELMDRLRINLDLDVTKLFPGVFGIEGEEAQHATLVKMLNQVRSLYKERYEVEILWYATPSDQSPGIGDPVTPAEPVHRHRLVVPRRTPTEVAQITQQAFVSEIQPVVATGAMGYASVTQNEESGFRVAILVGAGDDTQSTISIQINGELRQVIMGKLSGSAEGKSSRSDAIDNTRSMAIELPTVSIRSIRSLVHVESGKRTVLAVVDGFMDGECIVVAATVRPLGG